jgi:recombination protein RecR
MVELDALSALALGLDAAQLSAMYRSQFGVLRKYLARTVFDANGLKITDFRNFASGELGARIAKEIEALVRDQVVFCERCFNISDRPLCPICRDPARDARRLCVVEEPLDVLALERTGEFKGQYHVLHGAISPIDGIGPDRLRIRELLERAVAAARDGTPFVEVIMATNPTLEGEATAMYLAERLEPVVGSVTRIARGLPVGGDLEYADEVTLIRALQGRRAV